MSQDLDAQVRAAHPDRWLASRFIADPKARADVIALYAFNYELARVAGGVSNALMGEIRLTWWREAMEEALAGKPPRRHPVVEAVSDAFPPDALAELPEGRFPDLDKTPFTEEGLFAFLDATEGAVMALAARRLDPQSVPEQVRGAARAYGLARLWRARSPRLPKDWTRADVKARVEAEQVAASGELRSLPVAAFPAVAYAVLAAPYVRRSVGELEKRIRLTLAVMGGRI
jgi:phytoene synthase